MARLIISSLNPISTHLVVLVCLNEWITIPIRSPFLLSSFVLIDFFTSASNLNTFVVGLNWTVAAAGNMTVTLVEPAANIEINESDSSFTYDYSQNCSIYCEAGLENCTGVVLHPQYYNGS